MYLSFDNKAVAKQHKLVTLNIHRKHLSVLTHRKKRIFEAIIQIFHFKLLIGLCIQKIMLSIIFELKYEIFRILYPMCVYKCVDEYA